jgi:hypothetical protein
MLAPTIKIGKALDLPHSVELALHWESTDTVEKTNSTGILYDLLTEKYSEDDLEKFGYICLWLDYLKEQQPEE